MKIKWKKFFFFKKSEQEEYYNNIAREGKELLQCWRKHTEGKAALRTGTQAHWGRDGDSKKTLQISEFEIRSGGKTPREQHEHDRVCPCCGYLETIFLIPGWDKDSAYWFCLFLLTVHFVICSVWMTTAGTTWELLVKHCARNRRNLGT